jgi:hypothetical protein
LSLSRQYPEKIADLEYREDFAVRGLHYDIEKGLLLKLDSFLQIQLGAVYQGLHPVPDDEVLRLYKNRIIPIAYVETPYKHSHVSPRVRAKVPVPYFILRADYLCKTRVSVDLFEKVPSRRAGSAAGDAMGWGGGTDEPLNFFKLL